jgi:hypothetical protein
MCRVVERRQGGEQPIPPIQGEPDQESLAPGQGRDRGHASVVAYLHDLARRGEADVDHASIGDREPLGQLTVRGIERDHRLDGRVARDGDTGYRQSQRDDDQRSERSTHHGVLPKTSVPRPTRPRPRKVPP